MNKFTLPLFALVVMLGGLVAFGRPALDAGAQDSTDSLAGHPLVGAWLLDTDTEDSEDTLTPVLFSSDGTYLQVDEDGSAIGVWEATGERTANLTILFFDEGGSYKVRAMIEADETGDELSGSYTFEPTLDGESLGEFGPNSAAGTRIPVEAMGEPVGTSEDLDAMFEGAEGTPAA
jgi:hypothetical protein